MNFLKRTHYCAEVTKDLIGQDVVVCGFVQKVRNGKTTDTAGKHQQHCGNKRRSNDGQRDFYQNFYPRSLQNRCRFFQVGVHIAQNSADKNVGKGCVV